MTPEDRSPGWLRSALLEDDRRLVFSSEALEEVQENVSSVFKPHRLDTPRGDGALRARLHSVGLGKVSFNRLTYGREVRIDPERLERFYLIQMPVCGQAEIRCDRHCIASDETLASVLNPTERLEMRWSGDCDQLMLRIEREALELACSRQLGRPLREPLCFQPALRWRDDPNWFHLVAYLARLLRASPGAPGQPLIAPQLEQLVIGTLLAIQPHNYAEAMQQGERRLAPRHVKRVEEYIEAHAEEPLTPALLAEVAGVSLRTLYAGFRDFRQQSPMEYLRLVRLQRVRTALQTDDGNASVTETAMRWGFAHMGRFSQRYRQVFGETPSETRRRAGC
ncbi:AraC family transcriptional regulator [Halomonas nitroreducens]|uniref:AraC family transcriptional regulator n=1 Tax=Halomonas nitroreducens TaxID=447425 RepID=A0A3S0K5Z9_9GAMM|nr:AraC family transcriptional regulator [Halomonas nitroreducens]RTR06902.1 AraC family transcriptional regulator [Halomonas nitroreducens]